METRIIASLFSVLLLGCGAEEPPNPIEPAEFAEVCGQTEPVRLLGFEPWREVDFAWYWRKVGDHHLIGVDYDESDDVRRAVWSVGPCGEAPRQLFSGNFFLWTISGRDWALIKDDDTDDVLVVDPSGARPPRQLFQVPDGYAADRNDVGFFYIRPDSEGSATGELVMLPWPDDVWVDEIEPVVLLGGVKTHYATPHQSPRDTLYGVGDDLFVMTVADELVRVSTTDGDVEVLATGVRSFGVGYEPDDSELGYAVRYLVWQDVELSNDDPELPEGEIMLLDRSTGQLSSLGNSALVYQSNVTGWSVYGILELPVDTDDGPMLRLFRLPSLSYVDVPVTFDLRLVFAGERHVVAQMFEGEPVGILDLQTGEFVSLTSFFPAAGHRTSSEQRVLALLPAAGSDDTAFADSELWLLRDGETPELAAHRATRNHAFMPDGRLVTGVGLDENAVGDLIVVDDFEEQLIDRDVLSTHVDLATNEDLDPTMLTYTILEGDRAGLWLARLQPRL